MKGLRFLEREEISKILQIIENRFGAELEDLMDNYLFLKDEKGKIWICNKEIMNVELQGLRVQKVGLYFGFFESEKKFRLSIEGTQIIGKLATRNVVELSSEEAEIWMRGLDLEKKLPESSNVSNGAVILKHGNDFLGCGIYREGKVMNMIPKERRIKKL